MPFQRGLTRFSAFCKEYKEYCAHERVLQSMLVKAMFHFLIHFRNGIMQRVMLRYCTCLRIQHTSKECCVHSKTFFQGKTGSSIPLKEIVRFLKECPTISCNMSDALSKEYCIHVLLLHLFTHSSTQRQYILLQHAPLASTILLNASDTL